jgi:hypothetical protein
MSIFINKAALKELLQRYVRLHYREEPTFRRSLHTKTKINHAPSSIHPSLKLKADNINKDRNEYLEDAQLTLPPKSKTFHQVLFELMDEKNIDEVSLYQDIQISRTHFSKIRSSIHYQPTKATVFKFAIGLKLNIEESILLLTSAGFSFKLSSYTDLIIRWALQQGIFDHSWIDEALVDYKEPPLFSIK